MPALLEEYGDYPADNLPIVITSDDEQVGYMDEHYDDFAGSSSFLMPGKWWYYRVYGQVQYP